MQQQRFNAFAPPAIQQGKGPQFQGVQAPNVPMQQQQSMMSQLAPAVASKAMDTEVAGQMGTAALEGAKGFFAAGAPAASSSLAADAAILGGEAGASLLTQGAAGAGGKGAGAASGLTGAAAALGPYGIPILIGAGLLAASS